MRPARLSGCVTLLWCNPPRDGNEAYLAGFVCCLSRWSAGNTLPRVPIISQRPRKFATHELPGVDFKRYEGNGDMATAPKWTEEEDAQLRKLSYEGLSASMIAARMPGNRSRCSIIGRQHRLGLTGKQTQRKKRALSLPIKPSASKRASHHMAAATFAHVRALRSLEAKMRYAQTSKSVQDMSGVEPLNVEFLDLHEQSCRWPVTSELPHLFCGHTKQEGSSYCPHHHARSRTPAQVRRDPRRRAA